MGRHCSPRYNATSQWMRLGVPEANRPLFLTTMPRPRRERGDSTPLVSNFDTCFNRSVQHPANTNLQSTIVVVPRRSSCAVVIGRTFDVTSANVPPIPRFPELCKKPAPEYARRRSPLVNRVSSRDPDSTDALVQILAMRPMFERLRPGASTCVRLSRATHARNREVD